MLTSDGEKKWSEASAHPYFLAGVESRILEAFREYCKFICRSGQSSRLEHISLQFDGADVMISPMPDDFEKSAEDAIYRKKDFKVKSVEKRRKFLLELLIERATSTELNTDPIPGSPLYDRGNCILLAIYRLMGDSDFIQTFDEIALTKPIIGAPVRSYADCVEYVGDCSLSFAYFDSMKVGFKYLIHADGKGAEPHCVSMAIRKDGSVRISSASMKYVQKISDIKDTPADAVDKPIILKYETSRKVSHSNSQRSEKGNAPPILKMKAGAASMRSESDM